MLDFPFKFDSSFSEAIVLSVNPIRFVCSVKTTSGKVLPDIPWLMPTGGYSETGMHLCPNVQDRVLVCTSLGEPIILGSIPRIGDSNPEIQNMTGGDSTIELGYNGTLGGYNLDPSKPDDFAPGDFVYTSRGGSMLGILTGGISILRAGVLAQVLLCKYEGLVRVVTRNYQRFSDVSSRVAVNMKGRMYEYFAVDTSTINGQLGQERYQEAYGDIAAAEVLKATPYSTDTLPATDTRYKKVWLNDDSGNPLYIETLNQDGSVAEVTNPGRTITSGHTVITINPTEVSLSYNSGASTIVLNSGGITLNSSGTINITSGGSNNVNITAGSSGTVVLGPSVSMP